MIEHVRIVVAGDPAVGKTSLIKTLLSEGFEENVPDVLPTVVVPPEVTPERVHVSIIDTPSSEADVDTLDEELRNASVIVLVYDVSRPATLERVSSHWLRKLRDMELEVPITLAGNKMDLRTSETEARALESLIKPIMQEHRGLEVCIECSAKQIFNVAEVFYFAQKSVLHPTAPLYDVASHSIKPRAVAGLTRVFRLCDKDLDGELNDVELNDFQYQCFNVMLKDEELAGVKSVVKQSNPSGVSRDGGITLTGFVFLHTLFIQKGRLETTWTVLRKFGYDETLRLREDYVSLDKLSDLQPGQIVELSPSGLAFINSMFDSADTDKDGFLSTTELAQLFVPHPERPWASTNQTERFSILCAAKGDGFMSREAFQHRWRMHLFDDPQDAVLSMVYLGLPNENACDSIVVSKSRRRERRVPASARRDTLVVSVLGGASSGKTELVRGLAGLPFGASSGKPDQSAGASREVQVDAAFGGGSKNLIMVTVPESQTSAFVSSRSSLESCDVAVLVYDASTEGTFEDTARLYEILAASRPSLPIVFVASKSELPVAEQKVPRSTVPLRTKRAPVAKKSSEGGEEVVESEHVDPDEFCALVGLPEPQRISMKTGEHASIYEMLVGVALNPEIACAAPDTDGSGVGVYAVRTLQVLALASAVGLVAYGGMRLYERYVKPHPSSGS